MLQIRWHGHSCFEITNDVKVVTDPHDGKSLGIPAPNVVGDIVLVTHSHYDHNSVKSVEKSGTKVVTDERKRIISNVEIKGIPAYHDNVQGAKRGKMILYKFIMQGITFCHLGDLGHELDKKSVEEIGDVDILFLPIGGTFTLDAEQAKKVVEMLQPKIVVPMHYKIGGLSLPVAGIDPFIEDNPAKIVRVGNEIDIEKDDLPKEQEIWVFTL